MEQWTSPLLPVFSVPQIAHALMLQPELRQRPLKGALLHLLEVEASLEACKNFELVSESFQ